jgi:7-carboxy-7-deazaguanine synthase
MIINEIFYSLQGEGLLTGVPSVFIRLAGCPLRCTFCDTKYALDPTAGEDLSISEIIDRVEKLPPLLSCPPPRLASRDAEAGDSKTRGRYIVITGGEPMVNPQLPQLAAELKKLRIHITIETAGIAYIPDLACDLMSISPKLSNSGQKPKKGSACPEQSRRDTFFHTRQLIEHYPYQLKFVVDSPADLPEIRRTIASFGKVDPTRIMLMPQAKTREDLIAKSPMVAELCKNTGYLFCNRLQILLYNGQRGK